MALLQSDHALDLLRGIVDRSPAAETEVSLESVEDRFLRFASAGPTQNADRERHQLSIRVRLSAEQERGALGGWREARATCGTLDTDAIDRTLQRALDLAEMADCNEALVPMEGEVEVPESAAQRPTMDHTMGEKAAWAELALQSCEAEGLEAAGLAQTTTQSRTLVNSAGRAVHGFRSRAAFSLTASSPGGEGGSGFAETIVSNAEALDVARTVERAVAKACMNRTPEGVEPGSYTVVLEPAAVSALMLSAESHGFGAREFKEQSSFLCGRVGERLFPDSLRIFDDPLNDLYPGLPFDGEGTPKARKELLVGGALCDPVTDSRLARELGLPNSGHARPQPCAQGPTTTNLFLAPGHSSLEELIGGVQDGLLVSQFHYTNMIEPRDLTLTGMTRNGTFRIQGGKIGMAVKNLRFTMSLVKALQNVSGVGSSLEVAGALFDGEVICPALRIDNFRFTSATDF
jgi:predicted Zn-dependent protease